MPEGSDARDPLRDAIERAGQSIRLAEALVTMARELTGTSAELAERARALRAEAARIRQRARETLRRIGRC